MQQKEKLNLVTTNFISISISLSFTSLLFAFHLSSISYYIYFTVYYFYIIILHQILTTVGMKPADDATQTLLRVHKEQDKLKTHLGLFFILFLLPFVLYKYTHTKKKRGLILHIKNY